MSGVGREAGGAELARGQDGVDLGDPAARIELAPEHEAARLAAWRGSGRTAARQSSSRRRRRRPYGDEAVEDRQCRYSSCTTGRMTGRRSSSRVK